jgi:hypothetical protein
VNWSVLELVGVAMLLMVAVAVVGDLVAVVARKVTRHSSGMAILRRRRNGKFTGNWIACIDGKEVNLDTKDKVEARERAAAANIGEWPRNPDADARSVAAQVAAADDSAPAVMPPGTWHGDAHPVQQWMERDPKRSPQWWRAHASTRSQGRVKP